MARMRFGINPMLEEEADRIIRQSLRGVTKHSEKSDILTTWKEGDRRRREVYVADGVPDKANRQGMFHRSINPARPDLNSRDGSSRAAGQSRGVPRDGIDSLSTFTESYLGEL